MRLNPRLVRLAWPVALATVVAYGAVLRLDAISVKFDPVAAPRWLHRFQVWREGNSALRPGGMRWDAYQRFAHKDGPPSQYRSDPYTYLQYARGMRSFYAAHRREPLFPLATKVWLWLLHDHDTAVSFASAGFSVLTIVLTFALGREAFSPAAGFLAALLWAVESDVVDYGTEGWRDDAFTAAVVLTAWLMLRFTRRPGATRAVALGIAAGAACLVRITALSFVVPGLLYLVLTLALPWRERLRVIAIAAGVSVLVAGPFLFNCWREYGDPLYAINVHTDVYRATEGSGGTAASSAGGYIMAHLRERPLETIDTFVLGLTRYPFTNKWHGFDAWLPRAGGWLSALALAGLFLFTAVPAGRLILVVLVTSLVPYAVTWRLIYDWRFTEIVYPFFLIAAASLVWFAARALRDGGAMVSDRARMRRVAAPLAAAALLAVVTWLIFWRVTPPVLFERGLRAGGQATIMAGDRDGAFFGGDWPRIVRTGTMATRVATGPRATIVLPLPGAGDYDALLRVDPSTEPLRPGEAPARIQLLLNGRFIGACDPASTPDRVGICRVTLPADSVRAGTNRLTVVTDLPNGFRVWYVRLVPRR
jgi:Dolichyl-phosphate-mannose-protein mannosyltransferase